MAPETRGGRVHRCKGHREGVRQAWGAVGRPSTAQQVPPPPPPLPQQRQGAVAYGNMGQWRAKGWLRRARRFCVTAGRASKCASDVRGDAWSPDVRWKARAVGARDGSGTLISAPGPLHGVGVKHT